MTTLHIFLLVIFIFLCIFLIASVLLQSGKGGGMAGLGGGNSDSAFGAHTANVLQKFTMVCVISFFVLVVVLAHTLKADKGSDKSILDGYIPPTAAPIAPPVSSVDTGTGVGLTGDKAAQMLPVEESENILAIPKTETTTDKPSN